MDYAPAEAGEVSPPAPTPPAPTPPAPTPLAPTPLKILVAGGFGVGKTTMVAALSEIPPLSTEQTMTELSEDVDDLSAVPDKTSTTVAMDFGRLTIDESLILYLFGTPGQSRFWFMWDELAAGAVGAMVLVDLRRIDDSFAAIDYFENRKLPFVVAVNHFPGTEQFTEPNIREALVLSPEVPMVWTDARDGKRGVEALISLVEHALDRAA